VRGARLRLSDSNRRCRRSAYSGQVPFLSF
jgi:hypothetical protein